LKECLTRLRGSSTRRVLLSKAVSYVKLGSTWNEVKATIASAFGWTLQLQFRVHPLLLVILSFTRRNPSKHWKAICTIVKVASAVPLLDCTSYQRR